MKHGTLSIPQSLRPYSLSKTLTSGQTFQWIPKHGDFPQTTTDTYYLPTRIKGRELIIKVTQRDCVLEWTAYGNTTVSKNSIRNHISNRLGFGYNYEDALSKIDKYKDKLNPPEKKISLVQDEPFSCLISFICSPQAPLKRIHTMQQEIRNEYGNYIQTPDGRFAVFPTPESLSPSSEERLRELGLGYRAKYVSKTSTMVYNNSPALPNQKTTLPTDALLSRLQEFMGVGEKVAKCVTLYGYHRTETFPVDTRVKQKVESNFNSKNPTEVLQEEWPKEHLGYYQLLLYTN